MRNYINSNISSLFGSYAENSSMFTDRSLIKSGSYKKLMKAYYAKPENKPEKTTNTNNKTVKKAETTEFTKVKSEADALKKASEKLVGEEFWKEADSEKIAGAVKDFVKEYNDLVSSSSKVNSKEVSDNMKWMTSLSGTMAKTLGKIGIGVGFDNKLSLDETTLSKANAGTVKSLFEGQYSYGGQIADKAAGVASATIMNTSIYNKDASVSSALSSLFDFGI